MRRKCRRPSHRRREADTAIRPIPILSSPVHRPNCCLVICNKRHVRGVCDPPKGTVNVAVDSIAKCTASWYFATLVPLFVIF